MAKGHPTSEEQKQTLRERSTEFWKRQRMDNQIQAATEPLPPPGPEPDQDEDEDEEEEKPEEPVEEEEPVESKPLKQQAQAALARWAGEEATEQELRDSFAKLTLSKALLLHDRMRRNFELSGKILNERLNVPDIQKCQHCGMSFAEYQEISHKNDWVLNRPHYDPHDRNVIVVDHFCSMACVAMANQAKDGIKGISDRGMLAVDNPQNHRNHHRASVTELHKKAI